jgi:hypothetical protein
MFSKFKMHAPWIYECQSTFYQFLHYKSIANFDKMCLLHTRYRQASSWLDTHSNVLVPYGFGWLRFYYTYASVYPHLMMPIQSTGPYMPFCTHIRLRHVDVFGRCFPSPFRTCYQSSLLPDDKKGLLAFPLVASVIL